MAILSRNLYNPDEIVHSTKPKLVSVVALDSAGQVIGHYALERPDLGAVAEASDAIVAIGYRHHHLFEEMRPLLREEGKRLGLTGLVSYAVTNHPFTQKAEDHFGSHPCGVALGLWPRSFHNMPAPLTQRMSFVMYFDYVSPAAHVVHAAAPHREMITRIYQQYGISYELCEVAPKVETGDMVLEHEPEVQTGTIRICRAGATRPPPYARLVRISVTAAAQGRYVGIAPGPTGNRRGLPRRRGRPAFLQRAGAGLRC